jgi:hypothetical protein
MVATLRRATEGASLELELEYSDRISEIMNESLSQRSEFLKELIATLSLEDSVTLVPEQERALAAWIHYLKLPDEQRRLATTAYLLSALQVWCLLIAVN